MTGATLWERGMQYLQNYIYVYQIRLLVVEVALQMLRVDLGCQQVVQFLS